MPDPTIPSEMPKPAWWTETWAEFDAKFIKSQQALATLEADRPCRSCGQLPPKLSQVIDPSRFSRGEKVIGAALIVPVDYTPHPPNSKQLIEFEIYETLGINDADYGSGDEFGAPVELKLDDVGALRPNILPSLDQHKAWLRLVRR